jgi:hypothetical protein
MRTRNLSRMALLALCVCCALAAQPQCSNQDIVGVWAYSGVGWVVPTGESTAAPVSMIGIAAIDFGAKLTGPGTITTAALTAGVIPSGVPLDYDMVNATVQLNPDCSALLKYYIQLKVMPGATPVGPYVDRLVVVPGQGEILGMGVASPLSKPMWVYTMKRISRVPSALSWPAVPAQ